MQAGVAPALSALLAQELDSSPALIYLKDPDGRYVRVNRRYCEVMNVSAETLLGHVDLEVPAAATIDGPRLRRDGEETPEPLQLEYVVGAFADRPALSVMRFAVLDRAGVRVGTCGVAAPMYEAALARAACAELMEVAERADVAGLTHAAAPVAAVPPEPGPVALVPAVDPARPNDRELELRRQLDEREYELAEVREALSAAHDELEANRDQTAALRESLAAAEQRLESTQQSAAAELADSVREHEQTQAAQASEHERERAALAADLAGERDRAVRAEAAVAQLQADGQRLTEALRAARDESEASRNETAAMREGLAEAEERLESTQRSAAADLAGERDRAVRAEAAMAELRERADPAAAVLSEERNRAVRAEAALAQLQADGERVTEALRAARDELEASRDQTAALRQALADAEQRHERERVPLAADLAREGDRAVRAEAALAEMRERALLAEGALGEARERAEEAPGALLHSQTAPVTTIEPPEVEARPGSSGPRWSSAAQRAFAAALARSSDWNLTLRDAVKVLGVEGGWDAVCAWSPDPRVQRLRCTAMWTDPTRQLGKFETSTWQQLPSLGGTLLGRALGDERLTWLSPDQASGDRRVAAAQGEGLISGVLVPIKDGAMPVALLELLSHVTTTPSDDLSAALEATALQLAHLCHLARLGAEPRWAFGRF